MKLGLVKQSNHVESDRTVFSTKIKAFFV